MNKKYWTYLIHLSENMWSDTPVTKMGGYGGWPDGPAFRDKLLCEDDIWDKVVSSLPSFGINTLLIDVGDGICFESHPEIAIEGSWTKEKLDKKLSEAGEPPLRREGLRSDIWVLMDFGSVIVHIFTDEARKFYDLERLWSDAEAVTPSSLPSP